MKKYIDVNLKGRDLQKFLKGDTSNLSLDHDFNYFSKNRTESKGIEMLQFFSRKLTWDLNQNNSTGTVEKLPFYLEDHYFNIPFLVQNNTFNYHLTINETQIVEIPVTSDESELSYLWIFLSKGPTSRKSLPSEITALTRSMIEDIRQKMTKQLIHIKLPIFEASSIYVKRSKVNSGISDVHVAKVNLPVPHTTRNRSMAEDDVKGWFEVNKPFILIGFKKNSDIALIGHFCNPGKEFEISRSKMRDIGYW
uniref:CSON001767 protein n=1 Tax=Culicoides sonorensis TaxID=179676 RepID=A0A336LU64_CULSO